MALGSLVLVNRIEPGTMSAPENEPQSPANYRLYEFTNDWFDKNRGVWTQIIEKNKPRRILEIGSLEGRSTCFILEKSVEAAEAQVDITCIDNWPRKAGTPAGTLSDAERRFDHNIAIAISISPFPVTVTKLKTLSFEGLAKLIAQGKTRSFDLIYIDGSFMATDVLTDAVMAFNLLKVGGVMIFDDYLWSGDKPGHQDVLKMPKPAIDAFLNIFQRKMTIFQGAPIGQIYARKIRA